MSGRAVSSVMNGSYISATTGELHGIPAAEPILQLTFDVEAGGLSDGASALFLISGSVHADSGLNLSLGTAAPVLKQLGFAAREGGDTPHTTQVAAEWTLTDTAIERIEKIRDGGNLMIYPDFQYALISPGTAMPGWPQPHRPIRVPFPGQPTAVRVDAHQWARRSSSSGSSPPLFPWSSRSRPGPQPTSTARSSAAWRPPSGG